MDMIEAVREAACPMSDGTPTYVRPESWEGTGRAITRMRPCGDLCVVERSQFYTWNSAGETLTGVQQAVVGHYRPNAREVCEPWCIVYSGFASEVASSVRHTCDHDDGFASAFR
jgi:hypothetical protein